MSWFTYDFEVFAHDWLVVMKEKASGQYTVIHNDNDALIAMLNEQDIYCGFNSKHYDQFIMKGVYAGFSPEELKKLNDFIIMDHKQGWDYPPLKGVYLRFNNVDIKDDTQMGLSLKAIEGHFGLSVEESTVNFNIDRPLTEAELQEVILYCKHDVDTTEHLTDVRREYLKTKVNIGAMVDIPAARAMSMTNAKLTAAFLQAQRPDKPWTDERQYRIPDNLKRQYIPQEVFDFFSRMYDPALTDEEIFKSDMEMRIGDCPVTIAYGGIHAAIPHYMWNQEQSGTIIRNFDVGSYYPHLMTINGYTSRNIPNPQIFADMLERRMKAKREGDEATNLALKLIANTTYGATLNQYNDLYDPLMARSVCVSGQLYLLELAEHLFRDIPNLKIVQLNTDGIMVEFEESYYAAVLAITDEWQKRTGFELEEDKITAIYQKDVNNYVEIKEGGKAKAKGGYLVRGIPKAGAFNINNNATIVAKAITEYFVHSTPVDETINECSDISAFQLIAKAGSNYKEAYHLVDGEKRPVQKVNRVYATTDERYGKVFKVKEDDDSEAKIGKMPEHCLIDNTAIDSPGHTSIGQIDKRWYIAQALDGINKFLGIEPEKPKKERKKKMATAKNEAAGKNVYQKLLDARVRFLSENVKKTGKNMKLSYKYFELEDIVPVATPIFEALHLLALTSFTNEMATLTIVDCDNPSDRIEFSSPMKEIEAAVSSRTGGEITNAIQRLGSVETYQRRYLYMIALDVVESDEMEANTGMDTPAAPPAPKPPVAPEKREEIKKELTDVQGDATPEQLEALKSAVIQLRKLPGQEETCIQIAVKTEGFKKISKADCEKLVQGIMAKVKQLTAAQQEGAVHE